MKIAVAKKLNMSQHFAEKGSVIPVTILYAPPVKVIQVKKASGKDGYNAVQIGFSPKVGGSKNANKAFKGHVKGENVGGVMEFRTTSEPETEVGASMDIGSFQVGEMVNVEGNSKGRGFAGVMKRHGFKGFPASHGHDEQRKPGSIGQRYPQHVRKGLRMSGHMGTGNITVKNLQVIHVDAKRHLIALKGGVPGAPGMMLKIVSTGKVKPVETIVEEKDTKKK